MTYAGWLIRHPIKKLSNFQRFRWAKLAESGTLLPRNALTVLDLQSTKHRDSRPRMQL